MASKLIDKDKGWKAWLKAIDSLATGGYVKVGVLSEGPGAEGVPGTTINLAELAAIHEFGTEDGHIPARSFIRSTFDEQQPKLKAMSAKLIAGIMFGKVSVGNAFNILGAKLATEIKKKVTQGAGVLPPNAPSTVWAKARKVGLEAPASQVVFKGRKNAKRAVATGTDIRPLVDTGRMINAVSWIVELGKVTTSLFKQEKSGEGEGKK